MSGLDFLKATLKDYKVGAITVSSKYVVKRLISQLERSGVKNVVEYGAGDGVVTKEILRILPEDGKLIAFEINPGFLSELKKIEDSRLKIMSDDVITASKELKELGMSEIDAVISGIPFTLIKPKEREVLIKNTWSSLKVGGIFVVYQYSPLILPILKKFFRSVSIDFEPRNFLPYFIMRAEK